MRQTVMNLLSLALCEITGDVKTKNEKTEEATKLESMKKKERKKLRKMKSANFELATQSKALWEECRRFVT